MRGHVHSREGNQRWDWQAEQAKSPAHKEQDAEERGRGCCVTGRKRVEARTELRAVPDYFRFYRRARATGRNLGDSRDGTGERERYQHRHKNSRPLFVAAPPSDRKEEKSQAKVLRPIAKSADVAHENLRAVI